MSRFSFYNLPLTVKASFAGDFKASKTASLGPQLLNVARRNSS